MQRSYKACCSARIMYLCSWSLEMIKCKRFCVCTRSFQKTRYLQHCTISHDRKTSKTCRSCNKKGSAMQCCWCCVKPSRRSSLIWPGMVGVILCHEEYASQMKFAFCASCASIHDTDQNQPKRKCIPRWSSGQDFALSPRRPGFDSPSGKTFLLCIDMSMHCIHFCFAAVLFVGCVSLPFIHKL